MVGEVDYDYDDGVIDGAEVVVTSDRFAGWAFQLDLSVDGQLVGLCCKPADPDRRLEVQPITADFIRDLPLEAMKSAVRTKAYKDLRKMKDVLGMSDALRDEFSATAEHFRAGGRPAEWTEDRVLPVVVDWARRGRSAAMATHGLEDPEMKYIGTLARHRFMLLESGRAPVLTARAIWLQNEREAGQ